MTQPEQRRRRPGFVGNWLGFWFYWFDLFGPDKHPANSKVLTFFGFFMALGAELWWGWNLSKPGAAGITWPFVALVIATLAMAMGTDVFKSVVRIKNGGNPNGNHSIQVGEQVRGFEGGAWPQGSPDDPGDAAAG